MPGGVRPEDEGGLGDTAGLGERGRLLGVTGDEALFLALRFGLKKRRELRTHPNIDQMVL